MARILVRPNTYIYLAVLIFLIPIRWLLAWIFAMAFHEFCHWAAVKACGGAVYCLQIGVGGAQMRCSSLAKWKEYICILSGPIGGLLPVLLARWLPMTAFCCLILSLYNLLPILPLDGGRALQLVIGAQVHSCLQCIFLVVAVVLSIWGVFALRLGVLPFIVVLILILKNRKSPCK